MEEEKFNVLIGDDVVARYMSIEIATILVEALFRKYYNEPCMKVTLVKEDRCVAANES